MSTKRTVLLFGAALILLGSACKKEMATPDPITTLSVTLNGANLTSGATNIPTEATLVMVFSAALDPAAFEAALAITSPVGSPATAITYANQSAKVTLVLDLVEETTYTLTIDDRPIGQRGERLSGQLALVFTTAASGIINTLPPCTSSSNDCLQTVSLSSGSGSADFSFFSSFPIYEENAEWTDLTAAVIVLHGVERNAADYFNYFMTTLLQQNLAENVILISPFFKNAAEAAPGDYYWGGSGWREGQNAISTEKISSFAVLDQLIGQLADRQHFPALEKIIVTGHSSGALLAHLYAAANRAETNHPDLTFTYVVANSQYFYYPDGQRINENTNQRYTPTGCAGYDFWPQGYQATPPFLSTTPLAEFNAHFSERSVNYLLGNGGGSDNAFNSTNCYATLLGSTRFRRGENMFRYMELAYPGTHHHTKTIVNGIGHDGQGMYQSSEFRALLTDLLN
ncbi:MAG: hypothetical protein DA408_12185 [Bacteroidetes bacterium]|nr:MAG: hypothetical protein C7N36_10525 [Bacteroidota bacterium]PTM11995.1 MAG: hypothetical protein DA408_12185 [Bacteroidota bacterium]